MKVSSNKELKNGLLTEKELFQLNAFWRACNYLAVGMIYLQDNALLKRPLEVKDLK